MINPFSGSARPPLLTVVLFVVVLSAIFGACNPHPVQPLEGIVSAVNRQGNNLPDKTKIDFLLVMDNSGSMQEEQANLAENFTTIAEFLADLGPSADYRVAVTSMDLGTQNQAGAGDNGAFLVKPDPRLAAPDCANTLAEAGITTERPVLLSENVSPDLETAKRQIVDRFGCMATLGKGGSGTERGLEAMRKSLSCNGPNVKHFAQCCVEDPTDTNNLVIRSSAAAGAQCPSPKHCVDGLTCVGANAGVCQPVSQDCTAVCGGHEACVNINGTPQCQAVVDNRQRIYDPQCVPAVEPLFLRPDALLVIIFVTDENDCSAPLDNRNASSKAICRYGANDGDGDGVPEAYNDPAYCPSRDINACYREECGAYADSRDGQGCFDKNCRIRFEDYGQIAVQFACEYESAKLTDVREYFSFLARLKAQPREQLIVAAIAGPNKFTPGILDNVDNPAGDGAFEVSYAGYEVADSCTIPLDVLESTQDPDRVLMTGVSEINNRCCPQGQCQGPVRASCFVEGRGNAYPAKRYQRLVGALGENGIGCPNVDSERVTPEQIAECAGRSNLDTCGSCGASDCSCLPIEGTGELACGKCVNICANDFSAPLDAIRAKVTDVLGTYCLDKRPACIVDTNPAALGCNGSGCNQPTPPVPPLCSRPTDGRACETPAEFADPNNYHVCISASCVNDEADTCISQLCQNKYELSGCGQGQRWQVLLDEEGCSGGALVKIEPVPPAGSVINIEFLVATDEGAERADAGTAPAESSEGPADTPVDAGVTPDAQ